MISEKQCRKCRETKPVVEFSTATVKRASESWRASGKRRIAIGLKHTSLVSHRELKRADSLAEYHAKKDEPEYQAQRATYRNANRQKIRDLNNESNRQRKLQIIAAYGGACFCCGETNPGFLTLDHKHNDGAAWRKAYSKKHEGGYNLYRIVIGLGFPDDLQLACWNCNSGRHFNGGICPHEEERLRLVA